MISTVIKNVNMRFRTLPTLFSPKSVDAGTLFMLSVIDFLPNDKILDLGCGYGVVGILAAMLIGEERVVMSDIDPSAVEVSRQNIDLNGVGGIKVIQSDGFSQIDDAGFTKILVNPPYHADFNIAKRFIEKGFNRLLTGGIMVMVTRRKLWYKNKLTAIFGGSKVLEKDGYYVFVAEKRSSTYANKR